MSRDDFDIPDLGPAEPDRIDRSNNGRQSAEPSRTEPKRSSGGLTAFLLVLLVAACAGLGYWVQLLNAQLQQERVAVSELQGQMSELRGLLNMAESSVEKSGSTMLDKIAALNLSAQKKYKHLDSEIAKLWTVAHQRNKPAIEKQRQQLAIQAKNLDTVVESIAIQNAALEAQKKTWLTAVSKLEKAQKGAKAQISTDLKKIRVEVNAAQTAVRLSEEAVMEEQMALTSAMRDLTDRLATLESTQRSNTFERRVKVNEEAIKAFDATRRELNRSLLQIKTKINRLQLSLEKQAKS
ncbi:MAG: hypothetical protein ACPGF7_11190 [Pontibacterium sp.]